MVDAIAGKCKHPPLYTPPLTPSCSSTAPVLSPVSPAMGHIEARRDNGSVSSEKGSGHRSPSSPVLVLDRCISRGGSSNIKVCIRVRPLRPREEDERLCIVVPSNSRIVCVSDDDNQKAFDFDRTFWLHTPQQTLMDEIGQDVVRRVLEGFNNCLFAYGQTGSGKTHTILGRESPAEMQGLLPRIIHDLFATMEQERSRPIEPNSFKCRVSYLEIYNDKIRDLLIPRQTSQKLVVCQHPKLGVVIPDLTESAVENMGDVQSLLDFGTKQRTIAATSVNERSSRSHCIFTFELHRSWQREDGGKSQVRAKLNIVDLAGSERQKTAETEGDRAKEGMMINQSLMSLALVISKLAALSEQTVKASAKGFVPFRNSKLTYILSDSLSGNSQTVMVAAVSPAASAYSETVGTLRFASRVKTIKTKAVKNVENEESVVQELIAECERLRRQLCLERQKSVSDGDGETESDCEAGEQYLAMNWIVKKQTEDFNEALAVSRRMSVAREIALADLCLSTQDVVQAKQINEDAPHLFNLSEDASLEGKLLYFLPEGQTMVLGSGEPGKCKIKLEGLGMKPEMCSITNRENEHLKLTPGDGRVFLNNHRLTGSTVELHHRDRLLLGHSFLFRVVIPRCAEDTSEQVQSSKEYIHDALIDVLPEHMPEYHHCHLYVERLADRIGETKAKAFLQDLGKVVPLVEEANTITREVRPHDRLHFKLEVVVDLFNFQEASPEYIITLRKLESKSAKSRKAVRQLIDEGDSPSTQSVEMDARLNGSECIAPGSEVNLARWDVQEFKARLQHMREVYDTFVTEGVAALDFSFVENDPWLQVVPWEIGHLLEVRLQSQDEAWRLREMEIERSHGQEIDARDQKIALLCELLQKSQADVKSLQSQVHALEATCIAMRYHPGDVRDDGYVTSHNNSPASNASPQKEAVSSPFQELCSSLQALDASDGLKAWAKEWRGHFSGHLSDFAPKDDIPRSKLCSEASLRRYPSGGLAEIYPRTLSHRRLAACEAHGSLLVGSSPQECDASKNSSTATCSSRELVSSISSCSTTWDAPRSFSREFDSSSVITPIARSEAKTSSYSSAGAVIRWDPDPEHC